MKSCLYIFSSPIFNYAPLSPQKMMNETCKQGDVRKMMRGKRFIFLLDESSTLSSVYVYHSSHSLCNVLFQDRPHPLYARRGRREDERKSKRDDGCNLKFELADTNDDFFSTTTSTPFTLTLLHTTVHSIKTIIDQEKKLIKTLSLFLPTSHFSLHS